MELTRDIMLTKNTKVREVEFKYVDGKLKTKVLYKKGRIMVRYRKELDIDKIENMSLKEFHSFLSDQAERHGEERSTTKRNRRQRRRNEVKAILEEMK